MLSGMIEELGIHNLLQMPYFTSLSGRLILQSGNHEYYIYYQEGKLVHAEAKGKTGEEAFYLIVGEKLSGNFKFEQIASFPEITINKPLQLLIILSAKQSDEKKQAQKESPEKMMKEYLDDILLKHNLVFSAFIDKGEKVAIIANPHEIQGFSEELLVHSLLNFVEKLDIERMIGTSMNYQFAIGKLSRGWLVIGVENNVPMGMLATRMKNVIVEFEQGR